MPALSDSTRRRLRDHDHFVGLRQHIFGDARSFAADDKCHRPAQVRVGDRRTFMRRRRQHAHPTRLDLSAARSPAPPSPSAAETAIPPRPAAPSSSTDSRCVSPSSNPVTPNASADRAIVPRFPGSCSPAVITSSAGWAARTSSKAYRLHSHQRGHSLRRLAWGRRWRTPHPAAAALRCEPTVAAAACARARGPTR